MIISNHSREASEFSCSLKRLTAAHSVSNFLSGLIITQQHKNLAKRLLYYRVIWKIITFSSFDPFAMFSYVLYKGIELYQRRKQTQPNVKPFSMFAAKSTSVHKKREKNRKKRISL